MKGCIHIVNLQKGKCNDYGGTSVKRTLRTLYDTVLRDVIEEDFKESEDEEQSGFHLGRSRTDNGFYLEQVIEK